MDLNLEERRELIRNNIKYSIGKSKRPVGGQSCGIETLPTILKSEELDIEISIQHFRQNHKNREYGMMLFDLIITDLIK
jgi:hypothetical protein